MPIRNPYWLLLANLAEQIDVDTLDYLPKDEALKRLIDTASEDFGCDLKKWKEWLIINRGLSPNSFPKI